MLTLKEVQQVQSALSQQERHWRDTIRRQQERVDNPDPWRSERARETDARILESFEDGLRTTISAKEKIANWYRQSGQYTLGFKGETESI